MKRKLNALSIGKTMLYFSAYIGLMSLMWLSGSKHLTRLFIILIPTFIALMIIIYEKKFFTTLYEEGNILCLMKKVKKKVNILKKPNRKRKTKKC